ncbi:hypothetical protein F383_35341 [Gossypium arboreum]|uniref:Uncharacterized protein n=1 Tax=Gossypium arboreum TaxID=29729 RepID=A0A0B0N5A6_GOSAR|nr:hypothetical protein F383_35341 [Gossypium arboreum]
MYWLIFIMGLVNLFIYEESLMAWYEWHVDVMKMSYSINVVMMKVKSMILVACEIVIVMTC